MNHSGIGSWSVSRRWHLALLAVLLVGCSRARLCSRPPRVRVPLPPAPAEPMAPVGTPEIPLTLAPSAPSGDVQLGAAYGPAGPGVVAPPGSTGYSTDIRYPQSRGPRPTPMPRVPDRSPVSAVQRNGRANGMDASRAPAAHEPPPLPMPSRKPNGVAAAPGQPNGKLPAETPVAPPPTGTEPAPGIPGYKEGIESNLATGGQPALEGLRWLKDRGFRTVLNLSPESQSDPAEPSMVRELGLSYIPLPVPKGPLSEETVNQFNQLVDDAANRPLFMHDSADSPGSRVGALWYLHRVLVDRADDETARRQAAEIGLSDAETELWLMIQGYLHEQKRKADEPNSHERGSDASRPTTDSTRRTPRTRFIGR